MMHPGRRTILQNLKRVIILLTALVYGFAAPASYALSVSSFRNQNDVLYSGDDSGCSTGSSDSGGSGGGCGSKTDPEANKKQIWNYLKGKGLTDEAAAGILGNAMIESTSGTNLVNSIGCRGFVQWCFDRNTGLDAFAAQQGKPWDCLEVELDYMWKEMGDTTGAIIHRSDGVKLPAGMTLADALNGKDFPQKSQYTGSGAAQAAKIFHDYFERSNTATGEDKGRPEAAELAYKEMTGRDASSTLALSLGGSVAAANASCAVGTNANGDFVYYNQNDPQWQTGGLPVARSGCGPTSIAMIIATKKDKSVTPNVVAQYLEEQGTWSSGGIVWTGFAQAGAKWGMSVSDIGTDWAAATAALKAGNFLTVSGTGSKPFSSGGHIIVAHGITDDGKIIIANPAPGLASPEDKVTGAYTPAQLQAAGLAHMWVFG